MKLDDIDIGWLREMMERLEDFSVELELGIDEFLSEEKMTNEERNDTFNSVINGLYDTGQNMDEILNKLTRY